MSNPPLMPSHNDARLLVLLGIRRLGQRLQRTPVSGRIPLRSIAVPSAQLGKRRPQQLSRS